MVSFPSMAARLLLIFGLLLVAAAVNSSDACPEVSETAIMQLQRRPGHYRASPSCAVHAASTCPVSGIPCAGNSCCPGLTSSHRASGQELRRHQLAFAKAGNKSFPCPSASSDFHACRWQEKPHDCTSLGGSCTYGDHVQCPGSSASCAGNQCCPGVKESGFLTFPCPSAHSFQGCQSHTKVSDCLEPFKERLVMTEGSAFVCLGSADDNTGPCQSGWCCGSAEDGFCDLLQWGSSCTDYLYVTGCTWMETDFGSEYSNYACVAPDGSPGSFGTDCPIITNKSMAEIPGGTIPGLNIFLNANTRHDGYPVCSFILTTEITNTSAVPVVCLPVNQDAWAQPDQPCDGGYCCGGYQETFCDTIRLYGGGNCEKYDFITGCTYKDVGSSSSSMNYVCQAPDGSPGTLGKDCPIITATSMDQVSGATTASGMKIFLDSNNNIDGYPQCSYIFSTSAENVCFWGVSAPYGTYCGPLEASICNITSYLWDPSIWGTCGGPTSSVDYQWVIGCTRMDVGFNPGSDMNYACVKDDGSPGVLGTDCPIISNTPMVQVPGGTQSGLTVFIDSNMEYNGYPVCGLAFETYVTLTATTATITTTTTSTATATTITITTTTTIATTTTATTTTTTATTATTTTSTTTATTTTTTTSTTTATTTTTTTITTATTTTTITTTSTNTGNCSLVYEQCGGIGWTGPACCEGGTYCKESNSHYSQCLPLHPSNCVAYCQQCGGKGWSGKTDCCVESQTCTYVNEHYSGCADNAAKCHTGTCSFGDHVQCPGSSSWCSGNQCCPGSESFPCPSAKKDHQGCQSHIKVFDCTDGT